MMSGRLETRACRKQLSRAKLHMMPHSRLRLLVSRRSCFRADTNNWPFNNCATSITTTSL